MSAYCIHTSIILPNSTNGKMITVNYWSRTIGHLKMNDGTLNE
jgi:hypothetical protein